MAGAHGLLGAKFLGMEPRAPITVFDLGMSDFSNLTQRVLDAYEAKSGRTLSSLDCPERRRAAKELDAIGFFGLKGATMAFANRALISKVTAYKALYASMESK